MGIFGKSEDEKRQEELKKLRKEQERIKEALVVLGVDFDLYTDEQIKDRNKQDVLAVRVGMTQNLMLDAIVAASLKNAERVAITRIMDIISQNWILIRQNELLLRKLDQLIDCVKK